MSYIYYHQPHEVYNNEFFNEAGIITQHLDKMLENMSYFITTEKTKIKSEKTNLCQVKDNFQQQLQMKYLQHDKEKEEYENSVRLAKKLRINKDEIIDLNIGGTCLISTLRTTLVKYPDTPLGKMFSGKYKLHKHNGRVFLDRDGETFLRLLQYLRNGTIPKFESEPEKNAFMEELDFWQIPHDNLPSQMKSPFSFDEQWCAETLRIESGGKVVTKNSNEHGILFCTPVMDEVNNYIEFRVTIKVPCRGKSHLYIGLVDKSKYKYENLLSTFWKDSPSSFYWDSWNTKLIKTNETGGDVRTALGYGCQCEKYETKFGLRYSEKKRTIEFFKNGICLGVAFRDVPPRLTPALDIWFESGSVEILNNIKPEEKFFL